ncbi:MAG: enoyl-CoA hydratase/isomerase family protein [Rhizobiales bacterium]|nr:enoyl-CoA hydratase/isomerase family protein [Hyphomicrobiales bacterium]
MNRPEALNAFNPEQMRGVIDAFNNLREDDRVRVAILTGAGERSFAAGADIKKMAQMSSEEGFAFARLGHELANAIERFPRPVIAAVNGYAMGGGCEVALACDIRLASENAVFAQPEVTLGIPPGWGGSQRLTRLIGPGLASELIFTGRRVAAEEAVKLGLVNAVHPLADLLAAARALADSIAKNSPRAVAQSKRLIRLALNGEIDAGLQAEADAFGEAFETEDQREGMGAFVEKRAATFNGR